MLSILQLENTSFVIGARFVPIHAVLQPKMTQAPAGLSWWDYVAWFTFMLGWHGYFHWFPVLLIHHFSYTTMQLGHVFTYIGVLYVFCQFGVVRWFTRYSRHHRVLFVSLPVIALCIALMPIVASRVSLFLLLFVYMMAISFLLPFWKAYLTQRYQEDPGRMFGSMTVLTTVSSIIASSSGGFLASYSLTWLFLLCGVFISVAVVCLHVSRHSMC